MKDQILYHASGIKNFTTHRTLRTIFIVLMAALCAFTACSRAPLQAAGEIVGHKPTNTWLEENRGHLSAQQCQEATGSVFPAHAFPLVLKKVSYASTDLFGTRVPLSGLYVEAADSATNPNWVVYFHGTTVNPERVPSRVSPESILAACHFATLGAARLLAPDYHGQGDSQLFHPYLHAEMAARSGSDFLRAARLHYRADTMNVLISGYSQGGHASMALHQSLEQNTLGQPYRVMAAAHMSGPYALATTGIKSLIESPKPFIANQLAVNILASYQQIYGDVIPKPLQIFLPSFEGITEFILKKDESGLNAATPRLPSDLFTPAFLDQLRHDASLPSART